MQMGHAVNRLESSVFLGADESEVIDTRFGKITLHKDHPITFPVGLLGMPDRTRFILTEFPSENLRRFKLLQSLDDHALSFITLPTDLHTGIISPEDILTAGKSLV